jgi:hypothetical protein
MIMAAGAALMSNVGMASAQTACVRCTGPEATYICTATSDEPFRDRAIGLFCAARIANDRRHHSCAALRAGDPCTGGISVSFAYDNSAAGVSPTPQTRPPAPERVQPERQSRENGEPATLGEFAEDTVEGTKNAVQKTGETIGEAGKATGDAIKGAGRAIGDATKKTLKCLGSALNDC